MRVAGVVAEYNPFHAGHAYHIAETRRRLGECAVVCVMSGNFVQRGDCAVFDKWARARSALEGGADLVLELPTVWAASSAEGFARGAVGLLKATGVVDTLSFGSESGLLDDLCQLARVLEGEAYQAALRNELDRGIGFAQARQNAALNALGKQAETLRGANDCLAVEYLRAAGGTLSLVAVLRRGAGHDGGDHPAYPSASFLREKIRAGELPAENPASLNLCERAVLARLRMMRLEDWAALPDSGAAEGLPQRLTRAASGAASLEEFYTLAKTKRYAHSRIRRLTLWAFLGLTAADRPAAPPYLRVLGANERGRGLLREMKDRAALPVVTKPAHGKGIPLLELEARCTDLYQLCRETPGPCGAEWSTSPIMM